MTAQEIARYPVVVGRADGRCFICGRVFQSGDVARRVPTSCGETAKMDAGEEYRSMPAHESCLRRVP